MASAGVNQYTWPIYEDKSWYDLSDDKSWYDLSDILAIIPPLKQNKRHFAISDVHYSALLQYHENVKF
jgi:hypothetical protein